MQKYWEHSSLSLKRQVSFSWMLSSLWVLWSNSFKVSTMASSSSQKKKSQSSKRKNWSKNSWTSKKRKSRNKMSQKWSSKMSKWKKMQLRFLKDLLSLTSQLEVTFELCPTFLIEISTISQAANQWSYQYKYIWLIPYLKQSSITILSLSISFLNACPYFYNPFHFAIIKS